jgi:hypothetical protein
MSQTEVIIKIYADDFYSELDNQTSCNVECEFDKNGRVSYAYGWDTTIADSIQSCVHRSDWKRAVSAGCDETVVRVFYNTENGPKVLNEACSSPFNPFVLMVGDQSIDNLEERFIDKRIYSISDGMFDFIHSQIHDGHESIGLLFSDILELVDESFSQFDVVYEPEIRSLQMFQWSEPYAHIFYFATQKDIDEFRLICSRLKEFEKLLLSLFRLTLNMNDSDRASLKDFIKNIERLKEDTWQSLLSMSLAKTHLEAV